MAITPLAFDPPTGWNDSTRFPTYEGSEAQVRADMQELYDQTRDYINNTLSPVVDNANTKANKAVLLPNSAGMKYIRLGGDNVLETSTNGTTWTDTSSGAIDATTPTSLAGALVGNGSLVSNMAIDTEPDPTHTGRLITSGAVGKALQEKVNENLLHNWLFMTSSSPRLPDMTPIDQRGRYVSNTDITSGYPVDRWFCINSYATIRREGAGIKLTGDGVHDGGGLQQYVETRPAFLVNRYLTLSIRILDLNDHKYYVYSATIAPTGVPQDFDVPFINVTFPYGNIQFCYENTATYGIRPYVQMHVNKDAAYVCSAVKLEYGKEQTLVSDGAVIQYSYTDAGNELVRCMSSTIDPTDDYANNPPVPRKDVLPFTFITVPKSGSRTYKFTTGIRCLLFFIGRASSLCGAYTICGAATESTNMAAYSIDQASDITFSISGHDVTLTNSNAATAAAALVIGDVPTIVSP